MIAPCGINCAACRGHLLRKVKCPGCRGRSRGKSNYCVKCVIYNCKKIKSKKTGFCHACPDFPCKRLAQLDKRYITRYGFSLTDNLIDIRDNGIKKHVKNEMKKWKCKKCGGTICCHTEKCADCEKVI